ncbi:MFS transporter [Arthrobacter sp. NPDC057013]|uniref:MFS transporter n=1 Tax=Arthrobacter sp. NPDC057013 TaxID=3345999 RepID=UPI00363B550B
MNPTFRQAHSPRRGSLRPLLSNNAVIALCTVVTLMEGYNLIVFGSVVPLLLQDQSLKLDEATAGLVGGIVYAGALIGVLGGTALAERIGRQRVMALAATIFALGSAFAAMAPTPDFLGAVNLINATVSGAVAPHCRGRILGLTNTMAFIGSFMGPFLGGLAFASDGAPGLFTLYAGSAVLCVLISVGLLCAHRPSARQPGADDVPVLVES